MQLPEPEYEPDISELVKTYQIHSHSKTCCKYNKNECHFSYGYFFNYKTVTKPVEAGTDTDKKNEILMWRKTLPENIKSCIDNHLNLAKKNIIDPRNTVPISAIKLPTM